MIRIQREDFDIAAEIAALRADRTDIGAIVTFTGVVRDLASGHEVTAITLDHYPGMTEKELGRIEAEAAARWPLLGTVIVHRIGRLLAGDNIVLVIAASAHRRDAFEAAQFLMDYLKTNAPFWKSEETSSGQYWANASASDDEAARRWQASIAPKGA
jgi:molybdopterin synthase catalytic subunit